MPSLQRHARAGAAILVALALAATGTLLAAPASAVTTVDRIEGSDRYASSVAMSQTLPPSDTVFLVSGLDYPDALAAAPVVAAEDARMLLVPAGSLPDVVAGEIRRLAPSRVVVVGGETTIGARLVDQVRSIAPYAGIERIAGVNRIETSFLLLDRLRRSVPAADVWVASGRNFPDALAAGAVAARDGHGLVLTLGANDAFRQQLSTRLGATSRFLLVGSTASVGADVESALVGTGRAVQRYAGSDRYETAVAVNRAFTSRTETGRILLASGANFPDALGGAVLAGATGAPLYLTHPPCASSDSVLVETQRLRASGVVALGGLPSVSERAAALRICDAGPAVAELDALIAGHRAGMATPPQPLRRTGCLDAMAQRWANEMAEGERSGSSHNPDLDAEARACGLRGWGENVGRTWGAAPDPERMMRTWLASPAHRANLERASFSQIGIGIAQSGQGYWYYVLDFGS